jgi:hypothetical protein
MSVKTALILIFVSAAGFAVADQAVYDTKLENGWSNWSWASVSISSKAMQVHAKKAWEGLYFHHDDLSSAGFKSVSLNVYGGPKGGQKLFLHSTVKGKASKEQFFFSVPPARWTHIDVPVAKIGLKGQTFDGFWIQSEKPSTYQIAGVTLKSR